MNRLDGKRILLWAPRFFGYELDIKAEIERRGAVVDMIPDRPYEMPLMHALTRIKPKWIQLAASNFYDRRLNELGQPIYDFIVVVNGQTLSKAMLSRLRTSFPMARAVLYMWDSVENRRGIIDNISLYDSVFTFDPVSAKEYGMIHRPLFFSELKDPAVESKLKYHLSFVGTAHTDRYAVVKRLQMGLPEGVSSFWYLYLQAPWVFHYYRLSNRGMRAASLGEFKFTPLERHLTRQVFDGSRAILDIEHPRQRGLTIRTFETMGARKKLITTNANIRNYDFYDSNNILVINRNNPRVTRDFLEGAYRPERPDILYRYSIEGWLDDILGL